MTATAFGAGSLAQSCQGCHMPEGQGAAGAGEYPALAKNPRLEASGYLAYIVVNGSRAMPPFAGPSVGTMAT